ncbi:hypothetical protein P280DRAFT_509750 [Massarina eburnea CBS 473.64]|uniref:CFEM domain-containing protein n=1 Tax=Massarina eburnea CBS 473.64 TaxID=1395130 RepID=A0A6A6RSC3_9PLEO|nr:hypothetical protein P280DRAFT_509750 [Massarina eburnea CBS 473.64]
MLLDAFSLVIITIVFTITRYADAQTQNFPGLPACADSCVLGKLSTIKGQYHCTGSDRKCPCENGFEGAASECKTGCSSEQHEVEVWATNWCESPSSSSSPSPSPSPSSSESRTSLSGFIYPVSTATTTSPSTPSTPSPNPIPPISTPSTEINKNTFATIFAVPLPVETSNIPSTNPPAPQGTISKSAIIGISIGAVCAIIILLGVCIGACMIAKRENTYPSFSPTSMSVVGQKPELLHPTLLPEMDALDIQIYELESQRNGAVGGSGGRAELPEKVS